MLKRLQSLQLNSYAAHAEWSSVNTDFCPFPLLLCSVIRRTVRFVIVSPQEGGSLWRLNGEGLSEKEEWAKKCPLLLVETLVLVEREVMSEAYVSK